jgi:hypothetical protein
MEVLFDVISFLFQGKNFIHYLFMCHPIKTKHKHPVANFQCCPSDAELTRHCAATVHRSQLGSIGKGRRTSCCLGKSRSKVENQRPMARQYSYARCCMMTPDRGMRASSLCMYQLQFRMHMLVCMTSTGLRAMRRILLAILVRPISVSDARVVGALSGNWGSTTGSGCLTMGDAKMVPGNSELQVMRRSSAFVPGRKLKWHAWGE